MNRFKRNFIESDERRKKECKPINLSWKFRYTIRVYTIKWIEM